MGRPRKYARPWEDSVAPQTEPTIRTLVREKLSQLTVSGCGTKAIQHSLAHLCRHLGADTPLSEITTRQVKELITARLAEGAHRGTVRNEIAILRSGWRILAEDGRVTMIMLPRLKMTRPRQGFYSDDEVARILAELPEDDRPFVRFLWLTGWRRGEAQKLRWGDIDLDRGVIRIATSKNGEGRVLPYREYPQLLDLLTRQLARTKEVEARRGISIPWVFWREYRNEVRGTGSLTRPWKRARERAGLPRKLLHDFRRTAVRRFEDASVPRGVAMRITGHKTESIYARYNIISEEDIAKGLGLVGDHMRKAGKGDA